jgi:hypothetical protein
VCACCVFQGANLMLSILVQEVLRVAQRGASILYLQFDGGSENINRWCLAFCASLVQGQVFKKVAHVQITFFIKAYDMRDLFFFFFFERINSSSRGYIVMYCITLYKYIYLSTLSF